MHASLQFSGGSLTHPATLSRTSLPPIFLVSAIVAAVLLLAPTPIGGHFLRVVASAVAASVAHRGWSTATGRERQVRFWILVAVCVWFVAEVVRLSGELAGRPTQVAELSVFGLAVAAIGSFAAAAHGRMRRADEVALYLDAVGMFAATTAGAIVLGASLVTDSTGLALLGHGAAIRGRRHMAAWPPAARQRPPHPG